MSTASAPAPRTPLSRTICFAALLLGNAILGCLLGRDLIRLADAPSTRRAEPLASAPKAVPPESERLSAADATTHRMDPEPLVVSDRARWKQELAELRIERERSGKTKRDARWSVGIDRSHARLFRVLGLLDADSEKFKDVLRSCAFDLADARDLVMRSEISREDAVELFEIVAESNVARVRAAFGPNAAAAYARFEETYASNVVVDIVVGLTRFTDPISDGTALELSALLHSAGYSADAPLIPEAALRNAANLLSPRQLAALRLLGKDRESTQYMSSQAKARSSAQKR